MHAADLDVLTDDERADLRTWPRPPAPTRAEPESSPDDLRNHNEAGFDLDQVDRLPPRPARYASDSTSIAMSPTV